MSIVKPPGGPTSPRGAAFADLIETKIRAGEQWAADEWASERWIRGDLDLGVVEHAVWASLLKAAAQCHPHWVFCDGTAKQALFARPEYRAIIRTRKALVAWFVLKHTDLAFRLEAEARGQTRSPSKRARSRIS